MAKTKKSSKNTKKQVKNVSFKKKKCNYKHENLILAVKEAQEGKSIAELSRKYQIPESTIRDRKIGKYVDKPPGPSTVLSAKEECELVAWIFLCTSRGFPVTKHQLIESVKLICDHDKRKLLSIIIDQEEDFNSDEAAVSLNPKPPTVLAPKGLKNVYNVVNNNEKENVTVLVTANAAGTLAPTLVLFSGESLPKDVIKVGPANYSFGHSENGWMTAKNFYEYIANVFYPWLIDKKIKLPVILYIDGHSSHITLPLSEFCREKKIILIALYPNSTHILQPLDVALFRTFKMAWQKSFQAFCQKCGIVSIKKCQFALVLEETFKKLDLKKIMEHGFKACGLCPLDVNAIDFKKVFNRLKSSSSETISNLETTEENTKNIEGLAFLESLIDKTKLESFKNHGSSNWTGLEEDKSLFDVWYLATNNKKTDQIVDFPEENFSFEGTTMSLQGNYLEDADNIAIPPEQNLEPLSDPIDMSKDDETMENDNVDLLLGLTFDMHGNLIQDLNTTEQLTENFLTPELPVVIDSHQSTDILSSTPVPEDSVLSNQETNHFTNTTRTDFW
ncbi:Tigger transposable element-derived protein 1 [Eumeta japonica]|uniref:Tigger transposable element-derived protein 1 n=1 Tax=Eumeta variegata TaxID=151549 RepID=A0A4C1T7Y0_EUMVA|nr:Tigger transposable element-derived protein 1 [Eumeta japonica]